MTILYFILFLAIYVYCLKYIYTPVVFVQHPFLKNRQFPITGIQQFFLFLLLTNIFSLGSLMPERLLANLLICLFVILLDKNKPVLNGAVFLYSLFLLWLVVAILYSPVKTYGFRVFLKYLYPFVVLILASKITTTPLFAFRTIRIIFYVGYIGLLFFFIFMHIPVVSSLFFWWPAIVDFFPLPICIALAYYSMLHKKKYLLLALLFIVPSIMWTNRTGLLIASVAIVLYSLIRYKLKSLPYVVLGTAILVGSILYIPDIRNKMFKQNLTAEEIIENREMLTTDDIDSSGRFAMWEWSLELYFKGRELTGSGLGVLQERFYSLNHPFGQIRIVHNDYVQLLCDTGLIGLISYLSIFLFILVHCITLAWNKRNPWIIRFLAMITGPSVIAIATGSYFDNVVNYSLMTLGYAFALYGVLIGLNQRLKN